MAKKRARRGKKARKESDLGDLGEEKSSAKQPRGPRKRRKRDSERGGGGADSAREFGFWTLAGLLIAVIVLMFSHYAYYNWYLDEEDEDDYQEHIVSQAGFYDVRLKILSDVTHSFSSESSQDAHYKGKATFLLLVENRGSEKTRVDLVSTQPEGWTVTMDDESFPLKKAQNTIVVLTVKPGGDVQLDDEISVTVSATSVDDPAATANVQAGVTAVDLGNVTAERADDLVTQYVLVDRGSDAEYDENTWAISQTSYDAEPFAVQSPWAVITGFADALEGMRPGETKCFLIPSDQAYGDNKEDERPDGDLYYELSLLEIK
jgi:hypothetical protein